MIEVCFLGTGGWVATSERDNTSFFFHEGENLTLLDCPGSVMQKIKKLKYDPRRIASILITHIHPDHVYGLPSLVHSLMLDECLIHLYGSERTINFCQKLLDMFDLRKKDIKCRVDFISLNDGQSLKLASSLFCTALYVPHNPSSLAYLFRFDSEKRGLLYSGDAPIYPPLFQEAKNIDFLIHECSAPSSYFEKYPSLYAIHANSLDLGRIAQEVGVKCLIPCHFFGEMGFSIAEIEAEIKQNYKGKMIIPRDFDRIMLAS